MLGNQFVKKNKKDTMFHFIGIGGTGMCGIAEVLHNAGYSVSGSDAANNKAVERLRSLGITIQIGHQVDLIKNAQFVIYTTAVSQDNLEMQYAYDNLIPTLKRAEMLAELMRDKFSIAVAGTHGKTTTTSLISSILTQAGKDPTFVVGGLVKQANANAKLGQSNYIVLEADESDASFYDLHPKLAVITNIDSDHIDHHDGNLDAYRQSFITFLHNLSVYDGCATICLDNEGVRSIIHQIARPIVTYGFHQNADFRISNDQYFENASSFRVHYNNTHIDIELALGGRHNVLNATAAIATISAIDDVTDAHIQQALKHFKGVGRRFEILGHFKVTQNNHDVMVIDDYGHHPTEIMAVLDSIDLGYKDRQVIMVFQPHRYSRLRDYFDNFVTVLAKVDHLILIDVYSAGEPHLANFDTQSLTKALRLVGKTPIYLEDLKELPKVISGLISSKSIVLTQGAGDITQASKNIMDYFANEQ